MDAPLEQVIAFVEGRMPAEQFERALYSSPALESFLKDDPSFPRGTYLGLSVYLYAIEQDWKDPRCRFNVVGALCDFLDRKGVAYKKADAHLKIWQMLEKTQPKWLDIEPAFFEKRILSRAPSGPESEVQRWIRAEFLTMFRHIGKPPKWLQSPSWPIHDGEPLVFLGQISVSELFHDQSSVFIFYDEKSGRFENVLQSL